MNYHISVFLPHSPISYNFNVIFWKFFPSFSVTFSKIIDNLQMNTKIYK